MLRGEYTLVVKGRDSGFFSNVNRVVNHLHHSLGRRGCRAIRVDWQVEGPQTQFAYGTPSGGNLWNRFFEPLDFPLAPAAERATQDFADSRMTWKHAYRMYRSGNDWREAYHRAWSAHIRVRPAITALTEKTFRDRLAGSFCVGVHFRHPAHSLECPEPIPSIEAFVERTRSLLPADRPAVVYLATDAVEAVERFAAAFGEALVVRSGVERATIETQGQVHHDQPEPRVALGEQVLIDALLLARCDTLLHVTSNVATAVGYLNPGLTMVYCEERPVRFIRPSYLGIAMELGAVRRRLASRL